MGTKLKRNKAFLKIALLLVFSFGVCKAFADIKPVEAAKMKAPSSRVPASYTKGYDKIQEGVFDAQGFGEDFPEPHKLREPASESNEKLKKKANYEEEPHTVKLKEDLENELQLQRRVDVFYDGRVRLKNGAAIWATEDAGMSTPKLEVKAPEEIEAKAGKLQFKVYTNYLPFIKSWELRIFKQKDYSTEVEVALLKGEPKDIYNISYEFKEGEINEGEALYYELKVLESEDTFDLTQTQKINVVKKLSQSNSSSDKALKSESLEKIWGSNSLKFQRIPIRGSRVRIVGNNIPQGYSISYRGQKLSVDQHGKFAIEEHFPIGMHEIKVDILDSENEESFRVPFEIDVSGQYLFMVGLADFRVGQNKISEKMVAITNDDTYDKDVFLDGRLAFFIKGKIKGKYLITAQMDTTEGPVENMFDGLHRKNSESLFRRLDPDRYYPVYGDNSKTYEQAPTLGKFYVKLELDRSYLMWGNDNVSFNRTILSQYNRTLYGAHLNFESKESTKFGDRSTKLKAFGVEPETLLGHNEFLATGGRVYALRHNDVVQGSEKITLEVRDSDSGLVTKKISLKPNQDYEFDNLAGRILLDRPLNTFVLDSINTIVDTTSIGNDFYYLVVDYEYSATGQDLKDSSYGAELQKWLGDYFSVGGTYIKEKKSGVDYTLEGADATLKLGKQTFIRGEQSKTKNLQSISNLVSEDGGLSFVDKPAAPVSSSPEAKAWAVESQFFLNDFVSLKSEAVFKTWYRDYEAGYSTARRQNRNALKDYGYDLEFDINKNTIFKSRFIVSDEENAKRNDIILASIGQKLGKKSSLVAEYRVDKEKNLAAGSQGEGDAVGLRLNHQFNRAFSAYAKAQQSFKEEGTYTANDRWVLGTKFSLGKKWDAQAEYSDGDRGKGALAGLGYNIDESHKVYANFDRSTDSSSGKRNSGITLGQRKRFKSGLSLYTENQFDDTQQDSDINQLYGLDFNLNKHLSSGFSYQIGNLKSGLTSAEVSKSAISGHLTYTKDTDITAATKVSLVKNRGGTNFDQIVTTNSLKFKWGPSRTFLFEIDYSRTEDPALPEPLARFIEGNFGLAYRPVYNDRLNAFLRYTYLYDLDSRAQVNARNDQRVNIVSAEASYDLNRRWEIGARIAQKIGSERVVRGTGPWLDTTLSFSQVRLRYHLLKKWDALIEFRAVDLKETNDMQTGSLVGLDYHIGGNLKLGVGFNFTRFNDDLTNFNFNSYGWFLNIVGKL